MFRKLFNFLTKPFKKRPQAPPQAPLPSTADLLDQLEEKVWGNSIQTQRIKSKNLKNELQRLTRPHDMPRRIELCRQALALVKRQCLPMTWASWHLELAYSVQQNPLGSRADNLEQAIHHYEQALEVCTRQAYPEKWAKIQNNLALAFVFRIRGERGDNLEQAISHYEQALEVHTRQAFPFDWAMTQNNLANAYSNRIRGERGENLEQAIFYTEQTLEVYTRQAFPEDWAMTQNNVAVAYSNRIKGERADNLEQAIFHARQALEVRTRQAYPEYWAMTQNNLATAYSNRIRGERGENLEQAIFYTEQTLEVYTRQAFPKDWAMTQHNLGEAYRNRIKGERGDNLEQAIFHARQALEVRTRQAYPEKWAMTQNNLAGAFVFRIKGERGDNLEQAIFHYQQALEVYTRQAFPFDWAMTQNNLALAYANRIRGERGDNLEQAIFHGKLALEVCTRQAFPEQWAMIQNNLANALKNRIRGERSDNLEQAIFHAEQALEVYTRQAFPEQWAMTQHYLANAYSSRIRGGRDDNLEQAIVHLQQAFEVYTRQAFPEEWAMTQNNLANAYNKRIRGERSDNLEQAIHHYKQALEVRTRQAYPEKWAMTQNNLAGALKNRIKGERGDNLERAIWYYEQVLEVTTRQAYPEQWAMTQNNLAGAFVFRIKGERDENLEQAIWHYKQALEVITRQTYPEKWAMIQDNLGQVYHDRIRGERAENIEQAIDCYQQALEVRTPQSFPQDCRDTAYWLGRLLYGEGRFSEAREAFVTAHEAVEALRGEVVREGARRELAEKNADLYARLVFCCLHGANADEEAAFEYAAAGKGRAFVDLLASSRFDLSAVGADDGQFKHDWEKYRGFRQEIDNLLVQLTGEQGMTRGMSRQGGGSGSQEGERIPSEILYAQLRVMQEEAAEHWEQMTFRYPALTACESAPTLTAQEARDLSAELGATLVEYYRHAEGWCAFVVTPDEVRYVPLPAVDDELLEEMAAWKEALKDPAGRQEWTIDRLEDWYEEVYEPLQLSSDAAIASSGAKVVLAPFKELRDLPLFAARDPENGYVAQSYQLAFAPSLGSLHVAQKVKEGQGQLLKLLSVAYPGTPPLANVIPEADAVTKCFGQAIQLKEEAATPQAVLEKARVHHPHALHLGCHGRFDSQNPNESGLMLAGGWLTLQQIITQMQLKECHLVTLGACQSWLLTQGFMTAGSGTVISSQWHVNDSATRALFSVFYAHLTNGHSPANALRQATQLVRSREDWQHPYYWAPFNVNGLAHQAIPNAQPSGCTLDGILEQIKTLKRENTRGEPQMDQKRLERVAYTYLNGIVSRRVRQNLTLADCNTIIARLSSLSQDVSTVQSQPDLFALYEQIHKLVEEMEVLRNQLIPKDTDVAQMQQERFFTLEGFNKTSAQQQADVKALATLQQHLTKTGKKLEKHIKNLEELQAQNQAVR